jgi:hypothetical protein
VTRPIIEPDIRRDICLVTMKDRPSSPSLDEFLTAVLAQDWPGSPGRASRAA